MPVSHPMLDQLVVPAMLRVFFVFGLVGFAVGVGLIVSRARMHQLFGVMNRWVSLRRVTKWLAVPRDSTAAFERHRRVVGAAFVLLAAASTFVLLTRVDTGALVAALELGAWRAFGAWIVESLRWILVAGGLLAIAVGVLLMFFPRALRALEARADRWYSLRRHSGGADTMRLGFDAWVERHPRAMGWLIAAGALVLVVHYGMLLFAGA